MRQTPPPRHPLSKCLQIRGLERKEINNPDISQECESRTIRNEQGLDGVLGGIAVVVVLWCNLPRFEIDTRSPRGGIANLWTPLTTLISLKSTNIGYLFTFWTEKS